jgi:hypothetical protein
MGVAGRDEDGRVRSSGEWREYEELGGVFRRVGREEDIENGRKGSTTTTTTGGVS